jgi:cysteinyl-tRNA synthetase
VTRDSAGFFVLPKASILQYHRRMPLKLYNTLTKREELFEPVDTTKVTMYTCGPTVYGRPHIGNYSSFLMADLLRRWLEVKGMKIIHVKNITDVGHLVRDADEGEDKIEKQAREEQGSVTHDSVIAIARKYEEQYLEDERALNLLEPTHRPRASEYVEQMKVMIEDLLEKEIAYVTADGIYFDVSKFPQYGALSGNTLENVSAGARVDVNEEKKHPADFALWKFCVGKNEHHALRWSSPKSSHSSKPTAPEGFPGWHIECSAMSRALLGDVIDLHTGGEDNIFPHHECEIAQSESVTGKKPFVKMWLHKRRIDLEGEKMSKSLGNVLNIPDILSRNYSAQDIRYYLLSVHYRTNLKFSWKGMDDAKKARAKIVEWMSEVESADSDGECNETQHEEFKKLYENFRDAMDNDLNTSGALAAIFEMMSWQRNQKEICMDVAADLKMAIVFIRHTFGCFEPHTEAISSDAEKLVTQRDEARAKKDFAASDRLRAELETLGYEVRDTKEGTKIKKL